MAAAPYETEIAFLSGVSENGTLASVSFDTWNGAIPAGYDQSISRATKWGDPRPGTGASVSYFFDVASNWTGVERTAWQGGMALWSAVANVSFTEAASANTANFTIIRGSDGAFQEFARTGDPPKIGSTSLATPADTGTVISMDTRVADLGPIGANMLVHGGRPLSVMVHELGHNLGLGHGGPYNNSVNEMTQQFGTYDMRLWTTMSYIWPSNTATKYFNDYPVAGTNWGQVLQDGQNWEFAPLTPMMLDIVAVQRLYGAPTSGPLVGGNHTFGFGANIQGYVGRFYDFSINTNPVITIWDSGTRNKLDLSGFAQDAVINLTPGTFSSAGGKTNNIGIAFGTVIETAVGGRGNDTITASDVASTLIGGAGTDKLCGGAGNDVLIGGADADTFDPGGGLNILRDILSNMNSDTVFNFGLSTTIDIERILVGRSHLGVTQSDGDTTLSVGDIQILLEGVFGGGEFMEVARGQGASAHTMVTFETFLPIQVEGVSTEARAINGIANEPFMTGDGTVRFSTTLESASSAFANSLGVYKVAADGSIFDVEVVFADTLHVTDRTKNLGTPADGVKFGFFLIQNGFGAYGDLPDNLSFVMAGTSDPANLNNGAPLTLTSATLGALTTTAVFHSFQTLNVSDAIQVLSGVAPGGKDLLVAFEDLPTATGDNDFQDVVIRIHTNQDDLFVV